MGLKKKYEGAKGSILVKDEVLGSNTKAILGLFNNVLSNFRALPRERQF